MPFLFYGEIFRLAGEKMIKNVANILTGFRVLGSILLMFVPVFSAVFYSIYLLCGLSDMIDGTIARKTNSVSDFGSKMDTVADIVFVTASLVKVLPTIHIPLVVGMVRCNRSYQSW